MINLVRSVHQITMTYFKNLPYCTIAIDEGKAIRKVLCVIADGNKAQKKIYSMPVS